MDSIPPFLGLVFRAGRLAVGEEPVGAACRAHKAYLLLLASDAADNTIRRAHHFTQAGNSLCLTLPHTKGELGSCLGRSSCAMVAVTDIGFAAKVAEKLAKADPDTYSETRDALAYKAARAKKRRDEARAHDKKSRRGGGYAPKGREKKTKQ
jgi:ribosomal protein L7Ae-like RNA K-turn-binding protein